VPSLVGRLKKDIYIEQQQNRFFSASKRRSQRIWGNSSIESDAWVGGRLRSTGENAYFEQKLNIFGLFCYIYSGIF
jgi:hypothetical protein